MNPDMWQALGIALLLGMLVGLQREWVRAEAGIRTFPLITLLGTICGFLGLNFGGWLLGAGFLVLGATLIAAGSRRAAEDDSHFGSTTVTAAYVMYAVGALLAWGQTAAAVAVGGVVALLLHWKTPLHGFVKRIDRNEIRAIFRLTLIALVILPILPDRTYGPYDVLNPYRIWLLVVLIVGISVTGYLVSKFLGARTESVLAGVLGGIISSTATSVSYARRSKSSPESSPLAAMVIMIASTIVFIRVAVEVAIVAPSVLVRVAPQFAVMTAWMAVVSAVAYLRSRRTEAELPEAKDPSNLPTAVVFGILYGLVLFAVAAAKENFGNEGLYVVAAISGLTDMDAITLSTAQLMDSDRVGVDTGWRMMLVGALSNLVFKAGVVGVLGQGALFRRIALYFGVSVAGGLLLLFLWPDVGA